MKEANDPGHGDLLADLQTGSRGKKLEALQVIRKNRLKDFVPQLRAVYDKERNLDIQREILKTFADLGGDLAIEGLLDALHSHQAEIRLESVRRLARVRPAQAKEAMTRILEGEEWDLIRLVLSAFQPPFGTREDIPLLVSVIQRAPHPTIKYLATKAMNEIERAE